MMVDTILGGITHLKTYQSPAKCEAKERGLPQDVIIVHSVQMRLSGDASPRRSILPKYSARTNDALVWCKFIWLDLPLP